MIFGDVLRRQLAGRSDRLLTAGLLVAAAVLVGIAFRASPGMKAAALAWAAAP
jgi:hypothetical protein